MTQVLGAKIELDDGAQLLPLWRRLRHSDQLVGHFFKSSSDSFCIEIAFALEVSVEAPFCQPEFFHDSADAISFGPLLPKRPGGHSKDLLVSLGFLVCWVPHVLKITI